MLDHQLHGLGFDKGGDLVGLLQLLIEKAVSLTNMEPRVLASVVERSRSKHSHRRANVEEGLAEGSFRFPPGWPELDGSYTRVALCDLCWSKRQSTHSDRFSANGWSPFGNLPINLGMSSSAETF